MLSVELGDFLLERLFGRLVLGLFCGFVIVRLV